MEDLLLRRRNLLEKQEVGNIRAVCFEADGDQTVSITKNGSAPAITMQYSYNGRSWNTWDLSALSFGGNTKVYVRGVNNAQFSSAPTTYNQFTFGTDAYVYVSGIAESLLDGRNEVLAYSYPSIFANLFNNQTALRSAEGFRFEAQSVSSRAYQGSFGDCNNLINAPELSAIILNTWSCAFMFENCTSLINGPELLATTLLNYCYRDMFANCASLNSLRCHAKVNNNAPLATSNWLSGVASNGTFYGHVEYGWSSGTSGRPSRWKFVELTD